MNDELRRIQQLSSFFRHLDLYVEYTECCQRHDEALHTIHKRFELPPSALTELADKPMQTVIEDVESQRRVLDQRFAGYDFSENAIRDAVNEYKIASFMFVRDMLLEDVEDQEFDDEHHRESYVKGAVGLLLDFFGSQFVVIEGLQDTLESASRSVVATVLGEDDVNPAQETGVQPA